MTMFTINIPGSSANIGPGFDSMGIAIDRYLTLQVIESESWEFVHNSSLLPPYTHYNDHFIYKVAHQMAHKYSGQPLPPCQVVMTSDIPLARGLGSSAAAVVAGIELANQLCQLSLTRKEKLREATIIEGHPDNVAPTLFGGCVVSVTSSQHDVEFMQLNHFDLDLVAYIPIQELKTEKSRKVLPQTISHDQAAQASSISNLMIASLLQGDYQLAGKMMEKDLFHEPYRAALIPHYDQIKKTAKQFGAYGTVISGAGPTMLSFVPQGKGQIIAKQMATKLPSYSVKMVSIDTKGLNVVS